MATNQPCRLATLLLALALPTAAWAQQEKPHDDATMVAEYQANEEISATEILQMWANKFDALVVQDPQIQPIKIKFLTNTNREMTWGTMKKLLDFHDVVVVESQPSPGGPWIIRAHHRRNLPQKETPPWRYVEGKDVPDHEELVTAVFQIEHGAGNAIFATVRGLLTRDPNRVGNILYVPGAEVLIIVELSSRVRYYGRVIEALDVAGPRQEMKIYQITYAPVQELAGVLTSVLSTLGGQGGPGQQGPVVVQGGNRGGSNAQVMADQRTNKLVVAAFPIDLPLIERVIDALDVRVAAPRGRFHVYKCKDADAEDLAAKIQELFTGQTTARPGKAATGGGRRPGQPVRPAGGAGAVALGDGAGVGEVETRIVADERTNSLLVQAEERAYREILAVLQELDRKRHRVMIEAEVWEISTPQDNMSIGFELAALTNAHQGSTRPMAGTNFGLSTISVDDPANPTRLSRIPGDGTGGLGGGLTAILTRDTFDKIPILMTAVANHSESQLVTKPFAITNDNTPATFTLTDRVPFVTSTLSGTGLSQGNVQFADANSTLTIEPQVNSEDNLTLKLTLEITSFTSSPQPGSSVPPPSNTRKYEGEVTVPNNEYVVFGGLEREQEGFSETKIPFLGDIPILGHLFKNWEKTKSKTKLYIFIRPTIFTDETFSAERKLSGAVREKAHVESGRDEWLPPVVPDRYLQGAGYDLQDEAFDVFGTGSGNPFTSGATARGE